MKCSECDGTGEVEVRELVRYYDLGRVEWLVHREDCPECDGTGEVEVPEQGTLFPYCNNPECDECAFGAVAGTGGCGRRAA